MLYATLKLAHVVGAVLIGGGLIGVWLIIEFYSGWEFLGVPWLAGMVFLFAFEFIEGNTITRLYFMKLRRITERALLAGHITPELGAARHTHSPTYTHFLDLPLFLVIVALGVVRPTSWTLFIFGTIASLLIAGVLCVVVPRMGEWEEEG